MTITGKITGDQPATAEPERSPALLSGLTSTGDLRDRGFGRILGELAAATLVAAVVSLVVQWVLTRPHVPMPSFAPQAIASITVALLVIGAFWLALRARFAVPTRIVAWAGVSTLTTAVLSLMLVGTRFYLAGIAGDQLFRVEYVTRLTNSAGAGDFAYPGLPGYYPRGWFWLAGRAASLLHMQGWEIYKPFAILTMAVGTVLAYVAWCLVVRPAHALLAALAVSTVAVSTWAANEPYAWVFGAMIPPMAVVAWQYLAGQEKSAFARRPGRWTPMLLLGFLLGLLALFYTLLFGFFILVLVLTAVVGVVLAYQAGAPLWTSARPVLLRLIGIGLVASPLLLLQWVPYLAALLHTPVTQSGALRFLPSPGAQFPIFNYPTSFAGILCLIGLVWGLLRMWGNRGSAVARALILVTGAGYLWYGLSFLGTLAHLTLLPFKIELVMDETLRCAGVFGLIEGVRWLWRRVDRQLGVAAVTTVSVLSLLGMVGELQGAPGALSQLVNDAYSGYYPNGYTALGQHDTTQNGAWNPQLHDTITQLTGKPEQDIVVLSTYQDFLAYYPYWNFQTTKLQYANPLADYDLRRAAIESWAKLPSPAALTSALAGSQFRAPNVFVFTRRSDGLHLEVTRNVFPAAADNQIYDVVFPASLFNSATFTSRDVGPFTVVVRH
jgi:galactan 5-O-arabinofuranosyltransferase